MAKVLFLQARWLDELEIRLNLVQLSLNLSIFFFTFRKTVICQKIASTGTVLSTSSSNLSTFHLPSACPGTFRQISSCYGTSQPLVCICDYDGQDNKLGQLRLCNCKTVFRSASSSIDPVGKKINTNKLYSD